jgi:hypothetical protein
MTTVSAIADVADLADEVLAAQASFEPLNATMLGIPGYDHGLADVSAEAHDRLRQRAVRLAGRADVLMTSAQGEDAITAAVAAQQARALVYLIDARTIEFSVTDYNYVGPAAMVLSRMP